MTTEVLLMIYYAFFHSIINYGIVAWGGAYNNQKKLLQRFQNRLLKIIFKYRSSSKKPMNIMQLFIYQALMYHYPSLSKKFEESNSNTRNKSLQLPQRYREVSSKSSLLIAVRTFNKLPMELKTLGVSKCKYKSKLKDWIIINE